MDKKLVVLLNKIYEVGNKLYTTSCYTPHHIDKNYCLSVETTLSDLIDDLRKEIEENYVLKDNLDKGEDLRKLIGFGNDIIENIRSGIEYKISQELKKITGHDFYLMDEYEDTVVFASDSLPTFFVAYRKDNYEYVTNEYFDGDDEDETLNEKIEKYYGRE